MDQLLLGFRCAYRSFQRSAATTVLVVTTLSLGVGAVTAVFMVAHSVLLRPLPYDSVDELAMIWRKPKARPSSMSGFRDEAALVRQVSTASIVSAWRTRSTTLQDLAVIESWRGNLAPQVDFVGDGVSQRVRGAFATPNLFDLLGVNAALGRTFSSDDSDVLLISDSLWRSRFGADLSIVGRSVQLALGRDRARRAFTVAGVLPAEFRFTYPEATDLWMVLPWRTLELSEQRALNYEVVARLKPGMELRTAEAEIRSLYDVAELQFDLPLNRRSEAWMEPLHEYSVGRVRPTLALLGAICLVVLTIGCVSATNLLIARSWSRRDELLTQRALGASSGQLLRQLLAEALVLAVLAVSGGLALVAVLQPTIRHLIPVAMPRANDISVDAATVSWALLVGLVALTIVFFPSWLALRGSVVSAALAMPTATRKASLVWHQVLIGVQVALVTPLLLMAIVLLHSFWNLTRVDLGFRSDHIVVAELRLLHPRYRDTDQIHNFEAALLERLRDLPGVTAVSLTSAIPFRGLDWLRNIRTPGLPVVLANERQVAPNYFYVMGIQLVSGRLLEVSDGPDATRVVVVSQGLARRLHGESDSVGRTLGGDSGPRIVGVVADVQTRRVGEAGTPAYYLPRAQYPSELVCIVARVSGDTDAVKAAIPEVVNGIDPDQPAQGINTLDDAIEQSIQDRELYAATAVALAVITLILMAAGVCGVMLQMVSERTRELAIRAAVGASPRQQMSTVLARALSPLVCGLIVGWILSVWSLNAIRGVLFGTAGWQFEAFTAAAACVLVCGAVACYLPGRQVARLDVLAALRHN